MARRTKRSPRRLRAQGQGKRSSDVRVFYTLPSDMVVDGDIPGWAKT